MFRIVASRIFMWGAGVLVVALCGVGAAEAITNTVPVIVQQPAYQTVTAGGSTSFTVAAVAIEPFMYQWRKDGTNYPWNSATLAFGPVQPSDAGVYSVVASNRFGAVESEGARLTVLPVLDRALTIFDVFVGQDGKQVVRVGIRAAGDEHEVSFRLRYNTNQLSNPTAFLILENFEVVGGGTTLPPVGPVEPPIIVDPPVQGALPSQVLTQLGFLVSEPVQEREVVHRLAQISQISGGVGAGEVLQKEAKGAKGGGGIAQEAPRGSVMEVDTSTAGVVGIRVVLPAGRTMPAGTQQLAVFNFTIAEGASPLLPGFAFAEAPGAVSLAGALLAAAGTVTANSTAGAMSDRANRQSGYFTQALTVSNPSALDLPGVRVYVRDLPSDSETNVVRLANGLGTNGLPFAGVPFFDFGTIAAGGAVTFSVEFYVANRLKPKLPVYEAIVQAPTVLPLANAFVVNTNATRLTNGLFLAMFKSERERQYYIQYNSSVTATNGWKTSLPGFIGSGDFVQWIDTGPPRTETHPTNTAMRFYRVLATP